MRKYFTIAEVASLSGIKAHTLRIWEQRYAIFSPQRNSNNTRQYNIEELDLVLKLAVLNRAGYKISRLIAMDSATLERKLQDLRFEEDKRCREVSKLIVCLFAVDTQQFDAVLNNCIFLWGIDKAINQIIIPLMERAHLYSCKNCSIEFDFAVTAIRQKMFFAIEKAEPLVKINRTALLFLPQGQHYDLILLYYFYLLKSKGLNVLYMGTNVSLEKVKMVSETKRPDFLITFISPEQQHWIEEMKHFGRSHLPQGMLLATQFDHPAEEEHSTANVKFAHYKNATEFLSI